MVADSYRDMSIKSGTRNKRGMSSKIIIKSEKSKIPSNFQSFLSEGANKTQLIEIMFDVIKKNKVKVFNIIRCQRLFLSIEGSCETKNKKTKTPMPLYPLHLSKNQTGKRA